MNVGELRDQLEDAPSYMRVKLIVKDVESSAIVMIGYLVAVKLPECHSDDFILEATGQIYAD